MTKPPESDPDAASLSEAASPSGASYARLKGLFFAALELPEEEWPAYVDASAAGDADLRKRLLVLLEGSREKDGFLETPPALPPGPPVPVPVAVDADGWDAAADPSGEARPGDASDPAGETGMDDLAPGTRLGPWEVVGPIGRGGMGTVYEARRAEGDFVRRTAVKVVRPEIATAFFLRRFHTERRILAGLDHPNIARLLDAGATPDGLPYVVLEFVEGRPLLEHCVAKALDVADRLRLFRQICEAVDHAHRSLVVHRDLKPGNILVTFDGVPKLLDFGIAKLLESETGPGSGGTVTGTHLRLMTPDYASPEQLTGGRITTATDVYSLGVVLYELLTGSRPYDFGTSNPRLVAQIVSEREPLKPSARVMAGVGAAAGGASAASPIKGTTSAGAGSRKKLAGRLRGDLDNIVLTAMRREPERRYASVRELSDDVLRYLEDRAVLARRDTFGYRAVKLVRRNRAGVAAAAIATAALVIGFFSTVHEKHLAEAERARAQRRFNDVRKLAGSFLFEFHDAIQNLPGSTPARALVVRRGLQYLDGLVPESAGDPGLQRELAAAYQKVGDVQGDRSAANLGDTSGALKSFRKALEIRDSLAAKSPGDGKLAGELATTLDSVGDALSQTGDKPGAMDAFRRSLKIRETLVAADPKGIVPRRALATSYHRIASSLSDDGEYADALPVWRKESELFEAIWRETPNDRRAQRNVALACKYTGAALESLHDFTAALGLYERAVLLDEARVAADPTDATAKADLSYGYGALSICVMSMGDLDCGLRTYRKAFDIRKGLADADPTNVNAQMGLARAYLRIGDILDMKLDPAAAEENFRSSVAIEEALSRTDSSNEAARDRFAFALKREASMEAKLAEAPATPRSAIAGHWREARATYRRSLDIFEDMSRRGVLRGKHSGEPASIAAEIARCDEALAKR
ncbi:MAG: serine/threonine-protein kinase [Acidobacteriota bacterium]